MTAVAFDRETAIRIMRPYARDSRLESEIESYALTAYGGGKDGGFVPINIRHMKSWHWRLLFELGVEKLVVDEKVYSSLCELCSDCIWCLINDRRRDFKCKTSQRKLKIYKLT